MDVPKGYKLVPVEPTAEMVAEVQDLGRIDPEDVEAIWAGMLDAAPAPLHLISVVITDDSGTKVVRSDLCEKCDDITSHETRCMRCSVKPNEIYDEAKERELFETWYKDYTKTGWSVSKAGTRSAWLACAKSRAKSVEVGDE